MLRLNDEAVERFAVADISGRVVLGTPDLYASYLLPEVLENFSRSHPNVEIQLRCTRSIHLHAALDRDELDIALMTNQPEFRSGEVGAPRATGVGWQGVGSEPELRKPLPLGGVAAGQRSIVTTRWRHWGPAGLQWSIRSVCDSIAGLPGCGVRRPCGGRCFHGCAIVPGCPLSRPNATVCRNCRPSRTRAVPQETGRFPTPPNNWHNTSRGELGEPPLVPTSPPANGDVEIDKENGGRSSRLLHYPLFVCAYANLLRPHIAAVDAGDLDRLLHRVAAEWFSQLLVENDLNEGRNALLLIFARFLQRLG